MITYKTFGLYYLNDRLVNAYRKEGQDLSEDTEQDEGLFSLYALSRSECYLYVYNNSSMVIFIILTKVKSNNLYINNRKI